MNQSTMFSSGLELANLLLSSDLLHHSWAAIEEFYRETPSHDPTSPLSVKFKIQQSPIGTIISFISSPPCTTQYLQEEGRDLLVSSEQLMRENFTVFQFVSTKVNPTFSLLRAAVTLFSSLQDQLSFLRTQYGNTRPLIVTGHSIGGCIATLFTLWLLETTSPKDGKRPLCITFGSPLIGDTGLQQAISERPTWNSCFLHLSSYKDPIPKFFTTSPQNGRAIELGHKPFGTFLLCSESGFACFEEPESALDLMVAISSDGAGNSGPLQSFCYGEILKIFKCGVICRGVSKVGGRDFSPLQTGLFIQAEGINVKATQLQRQLENGDIDSLIAKMEKITKDLVLRKRNVFDPTKKLNDMKINMTYLEWYKKRSMPLGGYYDVFKSKESMAREKIVLRKRILTQYWVKMVKEAEKMPQKEGKFFLIKWLYGGNNYRRMVEPLDIAEFYKKGNKDYLAQRSDHYKLLEKWVEDEKSNGNQSNAEERNRACSLTEDSCFWAYVEEAMISCKLLRNGETSPEVKESQRENLVKFENYVMDLVRKYAVSTEIFLKQSSFMQWWEDYKEIKGASHHSSLTDFMSNCKGVSYKEESMRLNEMRIVTRGQKLSPEDKESLTRGTDEVSHSSEKELMDKMWSEELEETPSDPRGLEELNCDPMEVPPTISHHFSILHVLDLSYTEINSLPQSISRLVALQKLYLRSCEHLMELPPEIGELTNLEVLDLEGTEILCLPKEIAKLVNLMCLKVSFDGYANQTVIPRKVLPNLSRLNELIIDVTPYGEWWDVEVEAIIDDLRSLNELRALNLYLPTVKLLEELTLIFPGLVNFRFTVGRCEEHFISRLPDDVEEEFNYREKLEKGLKYVNGDRIPNEIAKVFKHVNAFSLQRHWTANSLSEFGHENLNEVKFCLVMECNEFRSIIDSTQFHQGNDGRAESENFQDFDEVIVLGSLKRLIVRYMKNMESIWKGPVGKGSLSSLKSLALHTCPNLTTLFTIDMLSNLINLEELIVEDCPKIDSLVSLKNSSSKSGLFLPNLKKISLLELPGLVSISSGLCIAPKLERMVIFYCPKLEKLSSMDISSKNLKVIKGEEEWWYALKWYESDVSTEHEDYLTSLFIPLRTDGDLFAQLTEDYIAAYDQGNMVRAKLEATNDLVIQGHDQGNMVRAKLEATNDLVIQGHEQWFFQQCSRFSSGLEQANLLLSSDLLHHSWAAIEEFYRETPPNDPTSPLSVKYKIHQQSPNGTIISFISSPPCTAQYLQEEGRDLSVSSEQLMRENFTVFQFVSTKVNPTFSLLRAAVTLFSSLQDQLSFLRTQYGNTRPLIVIGHSIGGCIATLFTLWLLEAISPKDTNRPLCITFGSPLIGDTGLQQAISERLTWNSCFLHVCSYKDPIPKLFTASPQNGRAIELGYKPFGTFLLCSELGFACFEEPESALKLMVAISFDGVENGCPLQSFSYGEILKILKCGVICRGVSEVGGKDFSPLQTGFPIQAEGINVKATQLQ